MHDAVRHLLDEYDCQSRDDYVNALREILQTLALLGLWRAKFFEHAAFYGGTALRVLYGLDRYSEDLDFSLLRPQPGFQLSTYADALVREIRAFGFEVEFQSRRRRTAIESAFLKTNTYQQLLYIEAPEEILRGVHGRRALKVRLEVDTDPPGEFETETKYVLQPVPFAVRAYALPDLFAGKLHAVLCRRWKTRVKGRDWYDLAWYAGRRARVRLRHLEARLRQTGDYDDASPLTKKRLRDALRKAVDALDVEQARREAARFVQDPRRLDIWSREFFHQVIERIETI